MNLFRDSPSDRPIHVLTLSEGDHFSYTIGGPVYRIAVGSDGKYLAQNADGSKSRLTAAIDYSGCFVYFVEPPQTEDSDGGIP